MYKRCTSIGCFIMVLLVMGLSSCIKEDLSQCDYNLYLYVKVAEISKPSPESELKGELEGALLYIFDENNCFLGTQKVDKKTIEQELPITLSFPGHSVLHVYSWGNQQNQNETVTELKVGDPLKEAKLKINLLSVNDSVAKSPSDLFLGYKEHISMRVKPGEKIKQVVEMYRVVGGVIITAKGLQKVEGTTDTNFSYEVKRTASTFNFRGLTEGNKVKYLPNASFDETKMYFKTNIFNVIPSMGNDQIEVNIYHGDRLIYTVASDERGRPLRAIENKLLNIFIDFSGINMAVYVSVTPWGVVDQIIEM